MSDLWLSHLHMFQLMMSYSCAFGKCRFEFGMYCILCTNSFANLDRLSFSKGKKAAEKLEAASGFPSKVCISLLS